MRKHVSTVVSAVVLICLLSSYPICAEVLFSAGDYYNGGLACERTPQSVPDARVYDNFQVTRGWNLTEMWGYYTISPKAAPVQRAYYEIRKDLSPGDGGTLLFSGEIEVIRTDIGPNEYGTNIYARIQGFLPNIRLAPGEYWMTLAPIGTTEGQHWLARATGTNGVGGPLSDGKVYFDSVTFAKDWELQGIINWYGMAYGLAGSVVPEPSSICVLVSACCLSALRIRMKKK